MEVIKPMNMVVFVGRFPGYLREDLVTALWVAGVREIVLWPVKVNRVNLDDEWFDLCVVWAWQAGIALAVLGQRMLAAQRRVGLL